jgi:cell division cycle 20-like protein 1 (cofactor of APC complex)
VHLYDTATQSLTRTLSGHSARVGAMASNSTLLSTGGRDRFILHRDPRDTRDYVSRLVGHRQEVCGVKYSESDVHLASGGNDNAVCLWVQGYTF